MKTTKLILLLALLPFFSFSQNADEVIGKYLKATNSEKVDDINAFKYNRSYVANANTDYDEEVVVVVDKNQLSRKKTLLKRDFYYVLNGNQGWVKIPMGSLDKKTTYSVKDLSAKEIDELSTEASDGILPFLNFEKKGYKQVGDISTSTINGKAVLKLTIEKKDISRVYYFDKDTGLVVREEWTENGITHTMDYQKYEETKMGIKLPVSSTYIDSKAKKSNKVTTEWVFDNPTKGVEFVK